MSKNVNIKMYRTIIVLVVLYGRETLHLRPREEQKLNLFHSRLLLRLLGATGDGVTRLCKNWHNQKLHNFCTFHEILL
jgi:hypothetical protein